MKTLLKVTAWAICSATVLNISAAAFNSPSVSATPKNGIYRKGWIDFNKNGRLDVYENPSAPVEARVQDLLNQMTVEEKTCQMATLYGSGRVLKDAVPTEGWKQEIWKDGIGNIDEATQRIGRVRSRIFLSPTRST